MREIKKRLIKDAIVIAVSIYIAVTISQSSQFENFLRIAESFRFLSSFVAGALFTSVFTAAPSAIMLAEIFMKSSSILEVSFFAALGGVFGDYIIFKFIKDDIAEDFEYIVKMSKKNKIVSLFHLDTFRWVTPFIGAFMIASPLPDEAGVTFLGVTKMKTTLFTAISFALHFAGALAIGLIVKGIL